MKTSSSSVHSALEKSSSKNKNLIIIALVLLLLASGGYWYYDYTENKKLVTNKNSQIESITAQKSELQANFDASLAKLENLQNENTAIQSKLTAQNTTIIKSKEEIRVLLHKKDISESDLAKAKKMIAALNTTINNMQTEVARLTQENKILGEEKVKLSSENANLANQLNFSNLQNEELEQKIDVASTLNASNINIRPIKVKKSGKEKSTAIAKRTDKLLVSFDVANRIIKPGSTDVYVLVIGPDGIAVSAEDKSSGVFDTRDEGAKNFTAKLPVELETSKTKNVTFTFTQPNEFVEGDYKIEIYQNGFLIGEGVKSLKKGGLFS